MKTASYAVLLALFISLPCCAAADSEKTGPGVTAKAAELARASAIDDYATLVHAAYADAHAAAVKMQAAVDAFLAAPDSKNLNAAKTAWLAARNPYSLTEAFRYYEGPIDAEGPPLTPRRAPSPSSRTPTSTSPPRPASAATKAKPAKNAGISRWCGMAPA